MHTLARIDRRVDGLLVTLTWPTWAAPARDDWYAALDRLRKRLRRRFPKSAFVWKRETTKAGVVHLHLLAYGTTAADLRSWLPAAWTEATRVDRADLEAVGVRHVIVGVEVPRRFSAVRQYIAKYIGKRSQSDAEAMGRWWGVIGDEHMPWSAEVVLGVTEGTMTRLIRTGRKWLEANRRRNGRPKFNHPWSSNGLSLVVADPVGWLRLAEFYAVAEAMPDNAPRTRQNGSGRALPREPQYASYATATAVETSYSGR